MNNKNSKKKSGKEGDFYPNANIGWLYYKDYYRGIDFSRKKDDKELTKRFEEKNRDITAKKLSHYTHETGLLKLDFPDLQSFELTTIYPGLVTGLGSPHETQRKGEFKLGFYFDHTTGLPVIPGSSIKGLLRSAFQQADGEYAGFLLYNEPRIDVPALEKEIFDGVRTVNGKEKNIPLCERDIFFEAVITGVGNKEQNFLAEDYITPHKSPFEDPVPLLFLKVLPQVTFLFQFRLHTGIISADRKKELFEQIIRDIGIGAKTNVGYGKFADKNE